MTRSLQRDRVVLDRDTPRSRRRKPLLESLQKEEHRDPDLHPFVSRWGVPAKVLVLNESVSGFGVCPTYTVYDVHPCLPLFLKESQCLLRSSS